MRKRALTSVGLAPLASAAFFVVSPSGRADGSGVGHLCRTRSAFVKPRNNATVSASSMSPQCRMVVSIRGRRSIGPASASARRP